MSAHQKQNLLDTLAQYLTSSDVLKHVMNSPGLDQKGGKTLSRDGTKAIFVGQNASKAGKSKNWRNKRNGKDNDSGSNSGKNGQGKGGKSKSKNTSVRKEFIYDRNILNQIYLEIGR